jgi:hypothetical protein
MLLAQIMKNALLGPLEQRIERLGRVVAHIAPGKLLFAMMNPLMVVITFSNALIGRMLVAHQMRSGINEFTDLRF